MLIKKAPIPYFPFSQEMNKSYLAWIIGLLTILVVLTTSGFLTLSNPTQFSNSEQMLTIMVPGLENSKHSEEAIKNILIVLESFPNFQEAKVVEKEQLINLLEPSLIHMDHIKALNFPTLIDVTFNSSSLIDLKNLTYKLRQFVAGIQIEPHTGWHHLIATSDKAIITLGWALVVFIIFIILVVISLITKFTLMAYRPIVDSLRLMGANNGFIASQFQKQAFKSSFLGSSCGIVIGILIIYSLISLSHLFELPVFSSAFFTMKSFLYLLLFPIAISLLSIIIARLTVIYTLYLLEK